MRRLDVVRESGDGPLIVQGVSADCGRILILGAHDPRPPFALGDVVRPLYTLFWQHRDNSQRDTIVVLHGPPGVAIEIMGMMAPHPLPWRAEPAWAVTNADGIVLGEGALPELHFVTSAGLTRQIVRWDHGDRELTDADRRLHDSGRDAFLGRYPDHGPVLPNLKEIPELPTHVPALWGILCDDLDRVWVQEYPRRAGGRPDQYDMLFRSGPSRWLVFDSDGALAGRLQIPANTELLHVASDRVVLLERDNLDVESVAVYGIRSSS